MKAMMTAMMTAAIKGCLFIFLPSACLQGPQDLGSGVPGPPGLGEERDNLLRGQEGRQDLRTLPVRVKTPASLDLTVGIPEGAFLFLVLGSFAFSRGLCGSRLPSFVRPTPDRDFGTEVVGIIYI